MRPLYTQNKYIYTYNVAVDAGYDFRKIKAPKYVGEKIIIELPKAEILKAEVDRSSLKVYEEDKNCFTPLTLDKINAQEKKCKKMPSKMLLIMVYMILHMLMPKK